MVIETCGGGSGRHLLDLAQGLASLSNEVHIIFSPTRAEQGFIEGLRSFHNIRRFPVRMETAPGIHDLGALLQIRKYIRRMGPFDIIHGHSSKAGALARLAAPSSHTKRVYTPHALYTMNPNLSPRKRKVYRAIESLLAQFATDTVIPVSNEERIHAVENGFPTDKINLVVNGVSPRTDKELRLTREQVRKRLGVNRDTRVIGFVGRLDTQKSPERVVRLASLLKGQSLDICFVMLGSGELEPSIRQQISNSNLENYIKLFTNESGEEFMPAFDIFLLTSRYEAMPYVLIEALTAGLPIVSTDVGGAQTVIEDGVNGYIVPEEDDISLMATRLSTLCRDDSLLKRMSCDSRERAKEFSLEKMVKQTVNVYESPARASIQY